MADAESYEETHTGVMERLFADLDPDTIPMLPAVSVPQHVIEALADDRKREGIGHLHARAREQEAAPPDDQLERGAMILAARMSPAPAKSLRRGIAQAGGHEAGGPATPGGDGAEGVAARQLAEPVQELVAACGALEAAHAILGRRAGADDAASDVGRARARLHKLHRFFRTVVQEFHVFDTRATHAEMQRYRADGALEARRLRDLDRRREATRSELADRRGPGRLIGLGGPSRAQRERLNRRLGYIEKMQAREAPLVDHYRLNAWLDSITNSALRTPLRSWKPRTSETRLLFYQMLNVYAFDVLLEEERKAVKLLLISDPREALTHVPQAERHLDDYFDSRSPHSVAVTPDDAARMAERWDRVRRFLRREYQGLDETLSDRG